MNATSTILLGLMLALATAPMTNAGHPSTDCSTMQAVHGYVGAIGVAAETGLAARGWFPMKVQPRQAAVAADPCGQAVDGDGETELGVGGGRFPAGSTTGCRARGESPHHGYGVGAQYWADESFGFNVAYSVGADGPALVQNPGKPPSCGTDGVISDNPLTDPLDCGAGEMGVYAPGALWTPATLGETVPGNGACDPFDGGVWASVHVGALVDAATGSTLASTPVDGHIHG